MDNKCSAAVEKYIRSKAINIQLAPPHNHQANAAEHAITTFKEHFIATLATVDMLRPLQLWDEFLPQVELTVNMLHFSRRNPKKSANQEVYGSFDFNKTPLSPTGSQSPGIRPSRISNYLGTTCNRWLLRWTCLRPLLMPPFLHSCNTPLPLL
jgi:hypothetical protein